MTFMKARVKLKSVASVAASGLTAPVFEAAWKLWGSKSEIDIEGSLSIMTPEEGREQDASRPVIGEEKG